EERQGLIDRSPLFGRYEDGIDRESAHEMLQKRAADQTREAAAAEPDAATARQQDLGQELGSSRRIGSRSRGASQSPAPGPAGGGILADIFTGGGGRRQSPAEAMAKSMARSVGSQLGRTMVRG